MATNEILPFAQGGGANVQSQVDYAAEPLRSSGNVAGIARAPVNNKALRQASVIAAGVAQFAADNQATNITDSLTPAQFSEVLGNSIGAVSGIHSVSMSNANVTLTNAQALKSVILITGTLTANLQLIFPAVGKQWQVINNATGSFSVTCKTASGSGVASLPGTVLSIVCDGTNIVSGSPALLSGAGWQKLESGLLIQWGTVTTSAAGTVSGSWPIAFPNACFGAVVTGAVPGGSIYVSSIFQRTLAGFSASTRSNTGVNTSEVCSYITIGY
jgi:hypothetical protein